MRTKTLVRRAIVDAAVNAHNCEANRAHRIERGHRRLRVHGGAEHYCSECAANMIEKDIATLKALYEQLHRP